MKDQLQLYRQMVTRLGVEALATPVITKSGGIRVVRMRERHTVWTISKDLTLDLKIRGLDGMLHLHVVMLDDKSMHLFYPRHADRLDWGIALEIWTVFSDGPYHSVEETSNWITAAHDCEDTLIPTPGAGQ